MSLKQILLIVILAITVGGVATLFVFKQGQTPRETSKITPILPSPIPTSVTLSTWTDTAGFSFQYPQGAPVDKHPDDTKNYANLTLTLPGPNPVDILMSDNTFKNLNAWAGQESTVDTTLGGKPAQKIIKNGQTTLACIDNEVLVIITGQDISGIVDSWAFIYPTPQAQKPAPASGTDDSGDVLEEE